MSSSFDPKLQILHTESKIIVALERISEAFRVLLWQESKESALSPIQLQMLIFLIFHEKEKCKISYLAREFNMTKATVSDSVRMLLEKKLVEKIPDPSDARSFALQLTQEGEKRAQKATGFAGAVEQPLRALSRDTKSLLLDSLLHIIQHLVKADVITVQRMCYNCAHFDRVAGEKYCQLLGSSLESDNIRIDCPEHLTKEN